MRTWTKFLAAALILACASLLVQIASTIGTRFSVSIPVDSTTTEVRAVLPKGRYVLVVSTNFSSNAFGVIPRDPTYSAQVRIQVETGRGILALGTNVHYLAFSLDKESAGMVKVALNIQKQQEGETLVLHLGRGF